MKKRILSVILTALLILSVIPVNLAFANDLGDVNGDGAIAAADARIALRASVGLETLTDDQKKAADVDGNPGVTASDARLILRASVGLETLHTHSYTDAITTKATCTEKGVKTFTCECGDSYTEEIAAAGHTEVTDSAVAPSCSAAGKTEGSHCSVCGEVITAQKEIAASAHTEVKDNAVAATCTQKGKTEGSHCSVCKTVIKAQTDIPATGHTEVKDAAVAATCTKKGKTEGSHCSVCKAVIKAQTETPLAAHKEVKDAAVAATCIAKGKTEGSHCSVCKAVIKAQTDIPATGNHLESKLDESTKKEVTCQEDGYTGDYKCTVCKTVTTEGSVIESTGNEHKIENKNVPASCTEYGYTADLCTIDGCSYMDYDTLVINENDEPTGHDINKSTIEATCTEQGYVYEICTKCEVDSKYDYTDAKGHSYEWKTDKAATCEETGSRTGTCKVCKNVTTEIIPLAACIPAEKVTKVRGDKTQNTSCKGYIDCTVCGKILSETEGFAAHTEIVLSGSVVPKTCTENGSQTMVCRYCNNHEREVITQSAEGHKTDNIAARVLATCTEDGYVEFSGKCTVCNETFENTRIILRKTGHNPTGMQTCTTAVTCTKCPEVLEAALGHDYEIKAAAYNANVETFFCNRCGAANEDELSAFNSVANKIITYNFYNNFSKDNKVQYIDKTRVNTSYSRFDFGIYTPAIRALYEDEMANTPDDYTSVRNQNINYLLPLTASSQNVSILTGQDIDNITVEKLTGIRISDVLSDYATKYTVGTKEYDLTKFKAVTINEDVIKVTIDVKNEKYSQIKNLPDAEYTSLQKIYDINIRNEIAGYEKNQNGDLVMTETDAGEGYEISMTMLLRELSSDAKVTYYFKADTYEPIVALYNTELKMDQTIDMKFKIGLFSLNGELDPIITTNYSRVYLFPNFFEKY